MPPPRRALALVVVAAAAVPVASASCGGGNAAASASATSSSSSSSGTAGGGGAGGMGSSSTGLTCGGPLPSDAGSDAPTGCEGIEGGVGWSAVSPLVGVCSASEACHVVPWTPSILDGIAAYECCDHRDLVAPGNPNASYFLQKLEGVELCQGGRMPLGATTYLSSDDLLTIRRWICTGAPP